MAKIANNIIQIYEGVHKHSWMRSPGGGAAVANDALMTQLSNFAQIIHLFCSNECPSRVPGGGQTPHPQHHYVYGGVSIKRIMLREGLKKVGNFQ